MSKKIIEAVKLVSALVRYVFILSVAPILSTYGTRLKVWVLRLYRDSLLEHYVSKVTLPKLPAFIPQQLLRKTVVVILIISIFASGMGLFDHSAAAATYTWNQTNWNGGLDGGNNPTHPTNQSGWTNYSAKDSSTTVGAGSISVQPVASSTVQTTDGHFDAGTKSSVTRTGTGVAAVLELSTGGSSNIWDSTLANLPATAVAPLTAGGPDALYVLRGDNTTTFWKYTISTNTWSTLAVSPIAVLSNVSGSEGDLMYPGTGDFIYLLHKNTNVYFYRYSISGNSWTALTAPSGTYTNGHLVYADGSVWASLGNGVGSTNVNSTSFQRYSISGDSWTQRAQPYSGAKAMAYPGTGDFIYGFRPVGGSPTFVRYSISGNTWTALAQAPIPEGMIYSDLIAPGDGFLYSFGSDGQSSFSRYSISGNSWAALTAAPASARGVLGYPGSGSYMYAPRGMSTATMYRYAYRAPYLTSGTFTSSAIDAGQNVDFTNIGWGSITPTGTTLRFQVRSATSAGALSSATFYGPTGTGDYYTSSTSTLNAIHDGHRYIQYRAYLDTTNTSVSPTLNDVTIEFQYYPASSTLTSSAYNTTDLANLIGKIQWTASTSVQTAVRFQLRTAPDNGGVPGTWSSFMGIDGTSNTYFTNAAGNEAIPAALSDASNDQWVQYKVFLLSLDGTQAPTLEDVTITYVVNAPPEFNPDFPGTGNGGVAATANSDGTITINYSVRDPDTDSGSATPGFVTPSFEYSLNNGSSWTAIATSSLAAGNMSNKAVDDVNYSDYQAMWNAASSTPGLFSNQAKIRVRVNDNEAANNIGSSTSATFTLDTTAPALAGVPIKVDASQNPAVVTLSATDDSSFEMRVGKEANLSDATYESYTGTKTISLTSGESVYAQFRDQYGNTTSIVTAMPPEHPVQMYFQDISNPETEEWRLFIAWGVISEPPFGFDQYKVYRSTDGGASYTLLNNVESRLENYFVDSGLSEGTTYSYKIATEDQRGNISFFSQSVTDAPDGSGGTDLSLPIISNVQFTDVSSTEATITWTTNKFTNSTVYFIATTSYPGDNTANYDDATGVPSMLTEHSVTLSNLSPDTQYYFMVGSQDPSANDATSADSSYTFTTEEGPVISNVTVPELYDNEATIRWITNIPSDSVVVYSNNADMSSPTEITGSGSLTTTHTVKLTGLIQGTKYYYYVKSVDGEGNQTNDRNVIDGVVYYYNFVTTQDGEAPVISNVETALIGETGVTITWTTDEPSTSQLEWGSNESLDMLTTETTTYSRQHSVVLNGLTSSATYYYRVKSKDKTGNITTTDNGGSPFSFTTLTPTTVTVRSGGGGSVDNRDLSQPVISNVQVEEIGSNYAVVIFNLSKVANGIVNYGVTNRYGTVAGDKNIYSTSHRVRLVGLTPATQYNYQVVATDIYSNEGTSQNLRFTTRASGEEAVVLEQGTPLTGDETAIIDKVRNASQTFAQKILESLTQNNNLANVSESTLSSLVSSLASKVVGSPTISGADITVEVGARTAIIRWTTDKQSNSLVAYAKSTDYKPSASNPYTITAGLPDDRVYNHEVTLDNLEPNTTYHYQVRSQGEIGPVAYFTDKTFTTTSSLPDIKDLRFGDITETGAILNWSTEVPTKTTIKIRNSETGAVKILEDGSYVKEHTYTIENLDFSTAYTVELVATDNDGSTSNPSVLPFTTVLSGEAPKVTNVRITTSLIPDRVETAQTIISWKTDKPSTSRVYFVEGGATEFKQATPLDSNLVRDHVVITTLLRPGTVYKIVVESNDSSANVTRSDIYTVLTPKPKASVIDIIFENLDKTFGFLNR